MWYGDGMTKSDLHRLVDELPDDAVGATGHFLHQIAHRQIDPEQWWFWTPDWQRGEREADAELAAGEGTRYDSTEEFLHHLEQVPPAEPS